MGLVAKGILGNIQANKPDKEGSRTHLLYLTSCLPVPQHGRPVTSFDVSIKQQVNVFYDAEPPTFVR